MKKNFLRTGLAAFGAMLLVAGVSSCKDSKKAAADEAAEATVVETAASDDTVDMSEYTEGFFTSDANKSETASDTTYAVTSTGLKYAIVKEGTGAAPTATDNVTVHYTGRLTDGTVFDSSVQRGEPATFPLQAVIPGWTEGLQLMKEGGATVFFIPAALAYGENGVPGVIPANAELIFEVQLIKVN